MTAPLPPSAALAAFLRGVERRAALLAELQCGTPALGDAALGASLRAFRRVAGSRPLAQWPRLFWGLLLAAPQLRRPAPAAEWAPSWRPLAAVGNGPRAALLLRLVAGLDLDEAAAVLEVEPTRCRQAVRHALRATAEGRTEAETWSDWEAAVQHGLKGLPASRLAQLARLREQVLGMPAAAEERRTPAPEARPARVSPGRWRVPAWGVAILCIAGLAATFVGPEWFTGRADIDPKIRTEPLPPPQAPQSRFDGDLRAWSDRDFDLLADPAGLQAAGRLPLLAWYAAQRTTLAAEPGAAAADPSQVAVMPSAAAPEVPGNVPLPPTLPAGPLPQAAGAAIAGVPAPLQAPLRARAARWFAWTPAQQAAYRQRQAQWEAQSPALRAEQRMRYDAWLALEDDTRRQVVDAMQAYDALAPEQREGLRANFIAQDASAQRGWLLGPALGADYPKLQPLLAQVPETEHAALLRVLRALSPSERIDLARLVQRTPPQEREALRRTLLSTAATARAAWLQAQATQ